MLVRLKLIFFLVYNFLLQYGHGLETCWNYDRATDNLREVVIGKCTQFQQTVNSGVFCNEGYRNCTEVWEAFRDSFVLQPKCNVSTNKLSKYVELTHHSIAENKNIFWENVYPFIIRFTNQGQRYSSVSDTLSGYIGDGIQWCSDDTSQTGMPPSGLSCPGFEATPDCFQSAQRAFWIAVSNNYARSASGEVFVLLNASVTPIFSLETYFAVYELPNIPEKRVHKATVLLINQNPSPRSKCDDPTLTKLAQKFREKQIQYNCIENRRDVVMTFCLDNPGAKVCDLFSDTTSSAPRTSPSQTSMLAIIVGSVVVLLNTQIFLRRQ